ncbi:MAG: Fic family protein [Parasphingorhabdus sp.]|jgi:Fic family protein
MLDLSTLTITPHLLKLIAEIDEFKGAWRLLQNQDPERLESLRHVATIESIGSSTRIEGSKLSDKDIEILLGNVGKQSFATRDQQEVAGYAEAMDMVIANYNDIPLTENYIKQLHSALLRHSNKDERHRGEYKKHTNHVEAFDAGGKSMGVIFETTSPFDTPGQMQDLVRWTQTNLEDKSQHPLVAIGIFNVVFLAIHPFQDGNGRLSRVLTTLLLLKSGYRYIPYSSLESIIERNKDAYYLALQRTQKTLKGHPDWLPWLIFFVDALKRQKDHLDEKLAQENPYANLLRENEQIMHYVDQHQRITTKEAEQVTGALRPTVKNRLSSLVSSGFLKRHGKGRGSWYGKA